MTDKLSDQETWDGEHLSELALSCLADGQDVIDAVARVHAESCAECTLRLGGLALESHDVGVALRLAKKLSVQSVKAAHGFPTLLVAAAGVLAAVCGAPALLEGVPHVVDWAFAAPRAVPILTSSFVALSKALAAGPGGAAVSLVSTFALALVGYAVARASRSTGVTS